MSAMDAVAVSGFLSQACVEIREAEAEHHSQKAKRRLFRQPIEAIDLLINSLEEMNLKGVSRVPLSYEPRLLQLRAMVAGAGPTVEQLDGLRTRVRIGRLMDSLYAVQEVLFAQTRPDIPRESDGWDRPHIAAIEAATISSLEDVEVTSPLFSAA